MSGGSYEYLCWKDIDDIFPWGGELSHMIDRLAGLGYAADAARESQELLLSMRAFQVHGDAIIGRLRGVWKAVEWWDSSDSGEDGVHKALEEYRAASGYAPKVEPG